MKNNFNERVGRIIPNQKPSILNYKLKKEKLNLDHYAQELINALSNKEQHVRQSETRIDCNNQNVLNLRERKKKRINNQLYHNQCGEYKMKLLLSLVKKKNFFFLLFYFLHTKKKNY